MNTKWVLGLACAGIFYSASIAFSPSYAASKCDAVELFGQSDYDALVCSGADMMSKRKYQEAIRIFEKALQTPLYDSPNFALFSRLAVAYDAIGNKVKSHEALEKADISLKVFTRVYRCEEVGDQYRIVKTVWNKTYKVTSRFNTAIANIMCGAAYEGIYSPEDLKEISKEAVLVNNFLKARAKVSRKAR